MRERRRYSRILYDFEPVIWLSFVTRVNNYEPIVVIKLDIIVAYIEVSMWHSRTTVVYTTSLINTNSMNRPPNETTRNNWSLSCS